MPQPPIQDVHVDQRLTDVSSAFITDADMYAHGNVFPTLPVQKQSDLLLRYDRGDFFRDEMKRRAPGSESEGTGFNVSDQQYFAHKYALHKDVADDTRINSDDPLDPLDDATEFLTQKALIKKEKQWVSSFMTTGVWGKDLNGASADFVQWDDDSSSPIDTISAEVLTIWKKTGFLPNRLVLSPETFNGLRNNPAFVDRVKHTGSDSVTTDIIARLIDIPDMGPELDVVIAGGVENTGSEGGSDSFSFISSKDALLVYAAPNPSLMQPTGGYTYAWQGLFGAGREGNRINRFRLDTHQAERVEIEVAFDFKVVESAMGVFFQNAVS